jgi:hypothetical protein
VSQPDLDRRILETIAAFTKERVERSTWDRILKKQSDADEIKKWDKELTRAYERFSVGVEQDLQDFGLNRHRLTPCYISTLELPIYKFGLPIFRLATWRLKSEREKRTVAVST